jgi:hypothetical protein
MPVNVLDLCAEFRLKTSGLSGLSVPCGRSLLGALVYHGFNGIDTEEKQSMRELAIRGGPYSYEERRGLLDYCQTDVDALAKLLPAMMPTIDLPRALLRGRYMAACARMEWTGVPIDVETLDRFRSSWPDIQQTLIEKIDAGRGIYEGRTFKMDRFKSWLASKQIPWPTLETGRLDLSDDCFREMSKAYPAEVAPIRELRHSLSQLRLESLVVGDDGRNRCLLSAFASRTGRNQPSNAQFIFGPSTWLRSLIKPHHGRAVAYVDYEQQEFAIAAALSGDKAMQQAYMSGDPYLTFAIQAGAVPTNATKATHGPVRDQFKTLSLGVQYGMHALTLAERLNTTPAKGYMLVRLHRQTYPRYWMWSDAAEMVAMSSGHLTATFGWQIHVTPDSNARSLRNFPLQANGSEMLRVACILTTEAGISVCAPVHDALLIESSVNEIEQDVRRTQDLMAQASRLVLGGFTLRTDAKIVRYPDRYSDVRGRKMFEMVCELAGEVMTETV